MRVRQAGAMHLVTHLHEVPVLVVPCIDKWVRVKRARDYEH